MQLHYSKLNHSLTQHTYSSEILSRYKPNITVMTHYRYNKS